MSGSNSDPRSETRHTASDAAILDLMLESLWWIGTDLQREMVATHCPELECVACSSPDIIPVIYGLPCRETLTLAIQCLCELGGFSPGSDSPAWCCRACKHREGVLRDLVGQPRAEYLQTVVLLRMNCESLSDEAIEASLRGQGLQIEIILRKLAECVQQRDALARLVSGGLPPSAWISEILRRISMRSF